MAFLKTAKSFGFETVNLLLFEDFIAILAKKLGLPIRNYIKLI